MIRKVGHPKLYVSFKIFDSRIVAILCYGSEIWGHTYQGQIEKIHVNFYKFGLGVIKTASNSAIQVNADNCLYPCIAKSDTSSFG